jgi:hypothetical protein
VPLAAGLLFAAFVVAKGIPTLRHDWNWPVDRSAVGSFFSASVNGWVSSALGAANPHPTTYLIAFPIAAAMLLAGPLAALALLAASIGYVCTRAVEAIAARLGCGSLTAVGVGLFALFNPWVYNEVVAGHLVMVLAYGGLIGLFAEMLRGREACPVRLALWAALVEAQLQFFIVALVGLALFAAATRKWSPLFFGVVVALPSIVGLIGERAALLRIPYGVTWQTNQSVAPLALIGLGGYFPGYSDRLGLAAPVAVWAMVAIALVGLAVARTRVSLAAAAAAVTCYVAILGVHGPLAAPYAWTVRNVPESGVFRELYDLAGVLAALLALLACAAIARVRWLRFAAFGAGLVLPIVWLARPPSALWVGANDYPHPAVAAPAFARVALLPAFQPLGLRAGSGDGADPDAFVYPGPVAAVNEYFPTYPVDMALASYEQHADAGPLRALGVVQIVPRPWMISKTQGGVGLAATSLQPATRAPSDSVLRLDGATPLLSQCDRTQIVPFGNLLGECAVFFGDVAGYPLLRPIVAPSDSIDARTAWIDARLAFAESPELAQAIGGALTQSSLPIAVTPSSWLLVYLRGALRDRSGAELARGNGSFEWVWLSRSVTLVECAGLCELVAQTPALPRLARAAPPHARNVAFRELAPWLFVVSVANGGGAPSDSRRTALLRFNERYDPAWIALAARHALPHVRVAMSVNGWFLDGRAAGVVLIQGTALLQFVSEILGALCVLWLLKALARVPTKRAP